MSKLRIIELLNKIANGEKIPLKIKVDKKHVFVWNSYGFYENSSGESLVENWLNNTNKLECEVEIIEDEEEIDIQSIEEVNHYNIVSAIKGKTEENIDNELKLNSLAINKLTKAVKQLEKKVNSIEQK